MTDDTLERPARVLVVYYSATGHALAKAVAEGAEVAGGGVRARPPLGDGRAHR